MFFLLCFSCCSYSLIYINLLFLFYFFLFFLFFISPCLLVCFVFFAYSLVDTLLFSCLPICVLVSFLFTWLVSVLVSFACQVTLALSCLWTILGFVCVCVFPLFLLLYAWFCIYHLSGAPLLFLILFCYFCVFVLIPFNAITNGLWSVSSPGKDWAWAFGVEALNPGQQTARDLLTPGSIDYWELPWRPSPDSKTWNHPAGSSTQCKTPQPADK